MTFFLVPVSLFLHYTMNDIAKTKYPSTSSDDGYKKKKNNDHIIIDYCCLQEYTIHK